MSRIVSMSVIAVLIFNAFVVAQGPPPRKPYVSSCGSEIAWIDDFETAAKKAAEEQKPIFWFVPTGYQTPMDRIQELYWYMMGGAFSDEAMVALVNTRFVPLRLGFKPPIPRAKGERRPDTSGLKVLAEKYGLVRAKFIEPGIVLLDKDANLVHVMDRLTTYNSRYMVGRMLKLIAKHPQLDTPLPANAPTAGLDRARLLRDRGSYAEAAALAAKVAGEGSAEAYLIWLDAVTRGRLPLDGVAEVPSPALEVMKARRLLASGRIAEAKSAFGAIAEREGTKPLGSEADYFLGVCRHLSGETEAGDAAWKTVIAREGRYAAKAKIELERWGPFIHGFEEYRDYPDAVLDADPLTGTTDPCDVAGIGDATRRAVEILLTMQRQDGSWDDSRYDFGGLDSMPNVHMAVTALVAWSLREWRSVAPERIDAALARADVFLSDEKNTNPEDDDELSWAHVYRLHYWAASGGDGAPLEAYEKKIRDVVRLLEKSQEKNGSWRHEYTNPFVTASVLEVLATLEGVGVKIDKKRCESGAAILAKCRGKDGTYSYGISEGGDSAVQGAAGRMPLCELALLRFGRSDMTKLGNALDVAFENHEYLDAVRKYDNHADRYANGGFFFWYDMLGRALAIRRFEGEKRDAYRTQLYDTVLSLHEADGAWIDSHELGKSYGTAMGLIVLKMTEAPKN